MKTISEIITAYNPKSICWYPGAGLDIQIIDTYLNQAEQHDLLQPDFFIFSDTGYWINNNGEIRINRDNGSKLIDTNDFRSIETLNHIDNLAISKDYIGYWSTWEDFKEHKDILPIDRTDDPFEEFGVADLLFDKDYVEEEKRHVCNQFMEKLSNTGVVYKQNNIHILFLAVDNTAVYNVLQDDLAINSVIYNRPGEWDMPVDGLLNLGVSEICSAISSPEGTSHMSVNIDLEPIGDQFMWRKANDLNVGVGDIDKLFRVI